MCAGNPPSTAWKPKRSWAHPHPKISFCLSLGNRWHVRNPLMPQTLTFPHLCFLVSIKSSTSNLGITVFKFKPNTSMEMKERCILLLTKWCKLGMKHHKQTGTLWQANQWHSNASALITVIRHQKKVAEEEGLGLCRKSLQLIQGTGFVPSRQQDLFTVCPINPHSHKCLTQLSTLQA